MHEKLRDHLLNSTGRWVTTHWRLTLAFGLVSAVVCVVLTVRGLEFRADRNDLVAADLEWNRAYADYRKNYPRWSDVIVCLAGDADDQRIDTLAREVAAGLEREAFITAAEAGFENHEAGVRLFRAAPRPAFERHLSELAQGRRLAESAHAAQALTIATAALERGEDTEHGEESIDRLERLLSPYLAALRGETSHDFGWLTQDPAGASWNPFRTASGRIRVIQVQFAPPSPDASGVEAIPRQVEALRERLARLIEASGVSGVEWGVTGIPAMEADETAQSIVDSSVTSSLAMFLITALMISVYRSIRLPLLAAGSLLVGIAWSYGWLLLAVGHLQLLSVVFTVILLGLGIDFGLHIVARLELIADEHLDLPSAMARVYRGIGPGLTTGAITVAAAFGAVALTDFTGMSEMGVIASGGIVLCLIAMCSVFPAALAATGEWKRIIRHRHGGETAHFASGRLDWTDSRPRLTLLAAALAVAGLCLPALRVRYDANVLSLHPPGIESVVWEKRIVSDDAHTTWAGLLPVSPEEAAERADRMRTVDQVADVGGMGMLYPADREERQRLVAAAREDALALPEVEGSLVSVRNQLAAVRLGLAARLPRLEGALRDRIESIVRSLAAALQASAQTPVAEQEERWATLNAAFLAARGRLGAIVAEALAPTPPGATDLAEALRRRWVGEDGSWLLLLYPSADPAGTSILDPARLGPFVEGLRHADRRVMGPPVQIYESGRLIVREYIRASIVAVAAIVVVLVVDFGGLTFGPAYARKLRGALADTACSIAPVAVGFVGAFAVMGILGEPLNFANIIVMPLIFGIGVAAGVYMVHRWRIEPEGRPAGLSGGTGRGITLTSLTTIISFACMLAAEHRGIRSLGIVMVAGLSVTLTACYTVLPALLQMRGMAMTAAGRAPTGRLQRSAYVPAPRHLAPPAAPVSPTRLLRGRRPRVP